MSILILCFLSPRKLEHVRIRRGHNLACLLNTVEAMFQNIHLQWFALFHDNWQYHPCDVQEPSDEGRPAMAITDHTLAALVVHSTKSIFTRKVLTERSDTIFLFDATSTLLLQHRNISKAWKVTIYESERSTFTLHKHAEQKKTSSRVWKCTCVYEGCLLCQFCLHFCILIPNENEDANTTECNMCTSYIASPM